MQTNSLVALVADGLKVPAGECGRVLAILADKQAAEVRFDSGVRMVVPLASLDEFEGVTSSQPPETIALPAQGQASIDPEAIIDMMVTVALDTQALDAAVCSIEAKVARMKDQIAKLSEERKELSKVLPHAKSVARRVQRMKLSDAAKVAEVAASAGAYARKR